MIRQKKYLQAISDQGLEYDFIQFLMHSDSIVIKEYARQFCKLKRVKPYKNDEERQAFLDKLIKLAQVEWLDED